MLCEDSDSQIVLVVSYEIKAPGDKDDSPEMKLCNLRWHCNLLAWVTCYHLAALDRGKNESNSLKNTIEDRYKGRRTIKVLWKNTVEDEYKWERTRAVTTLKIKNGE